MAKKATGSRSLSQMGAAPTTSGTPKKPSASKLKPRLISKDTADSLELLKQQIDLAEKHLKKMPAARESGVVVSVQDVVREENHDRHCVGTSLKLTEDGLRIVFTRFSEDESEYFEYRSDRIDEFPTAVRLELAAKVPELIRLAKQAESEIKNVSDAVIAEIQAAMDETLEVYE